MKFFLNTQGFSLIEILVSLVLIGLIATAFFPVIIYSYKNIYSSGDADNSLYQLQQKMENGTERTEIDATGITIEFPEKPSIEVRGTTYSVHQNANGRQLTIIYFQPE